MTEQHPAECYAPITEDEVAGWFPTCTPSGGNPRWGAPDKASCKALARRIEAVRAMSRACEADEDLVAARARLPLVVKDAQSLNKNLGLLTEAAGKYGAVALSAETLALETALAAFLRVAPVRPQGHQPANWVASALAWAPLIAACLQGPDGSLPSLSTEGGPVTAVLREAVQRVYGLELDAIDIGRQLRRAPRP